MVVSCSVYSHNERVSSKNCGYYSSSSAADSYSTPSYASFCRVCARPYTIPPLLSPDPLSSPQFTASPAAVVVAAGETARLACGATGEPPPSVAWYREGGGEVGNGGRFTVNTDTGELTVAAVELSDGGGYYCVASNAVGSVRSLIAPLQLAGKIGEANNIQPIALGVDMQHFSDGDCLCFTEH